MRRTLASVSIAVLLAMGLSACGAQNQSSDSPASRQSTSQRSDAVEGAEPVDEQTLIDVAVDTEKAMRSWGSDSTIPVDQLTQKTAKDVLATLDPGHVPSKPDLLSGVRGEDGAGPDMPWDGECLSGQPCEGWTMRDWMYNDAYAYGARWVDGPTARVIDSRKGLVQVTGTVRAVFLQDRDTFGQASWPDKEWYALTPSWKDYEIEDTLTIRDGKAVEYVNGPSDPWWINPWLRAWNDSMASDTDNGTRVAIPVEGDPQETERYMNIKHMAVEDFQTAPRLMGGDTTGGTPVDWSLWDGLIKLKPTTCQNPGACQD